MSLKSGWKVANHKLVLFFHHPATNTCHISALVVLLCLKYFPVSPSLVLLDPLVFPFRWKTVWRCILVVCPVGLAYTPVLVMYHDSSYICGGAQEIPILVSNFFAFFSRIFFLKGQWGCHGQSCHEIEKSWARNQTRGTWGGRVSWVLEVRSSQWFQ